jgi:4-hydroxybenzoate polyprenyltransferase
LLHSGDALLAAGLAFIAFCAASSAVYLINDLKDREQDRNHPLKRHRPLAAGTLPVPVAVVAAGALAAGALGLGWSLGLWVALHTVLYLALNLLYTLHLKRVVILDVMSISLGFLLRILAGAAAVEVEVSSWLALCTIFLSLFLAFSKRRHELVLLADDAAEQRQVLTHYSPAFLDQMINVVTASTVIAYSLYAISPATEERFQTRHLVYTILFVLFGIFRYLYLIYQEPDERNPTEAILRDPPFLLNMLLWGVAVLVIIYGI